MEEYIEPHPDRAVLLTIDMQNDFSLPGAPAEIKGTDAAVPRIKQLVETFRSTDSPIVHVVRLYKEDGANVDLCRRKKVQSGAEIVRPGTNGAELLDELKPEPDICLDVEQLLNGEFQEVGPGEWIMYKPRWGAFYGTGLDAFLTHHSIDTLIVCGCNFPNCPRTTMYEASERDYRLVFVPDATSGVYNRGIEELENIGVAVKNTAETIKWISE